MALVELAVAVHAVLALDCGFPGSEATAATHGPAGPVERLVIAVAAASTKAQLAGVSHAPAELTPIAALPHASG